MRKLRQRIALRIAPWLDPKIALNRQFNTITTSTSAFNPTVTYVGGTYKWQ